MFNMCYGFFQRAARCSASLKTPLLSCLLRLVSRGRSTRFSKSTLAASRTTSRQEFGGAENASKHRSEYLYEINNHPKHI